MNEIDNDNAHALLEQSTQTTRVEYSDPTPAHELHVSHRILKKIARWRERHRKVRDMSLDQIAVATARLRYADHLFDHRIKRALGWGGVLLAVSQVICADVIFVRYLLGKFGTSIDPEMMVAWFSATVVEIVGIIVVIAKYLFPGTGNNWAHEPTSNSRPHTPEN